MTKEFSVAISRDMNLGTRQASAIVKMFDEGLPIPFIARYRKEQTGSADEVSLLAIKKRLATLKNFDEQKQQIIAELEKSESLSEEQLSALTTIDDIYEFRDLAAQLRFAKKNDVFSHLAGTLLAGQLEASRIPDVVAPLTSELDKFSGVVKSTRGFTCESTNGLRGETLKAAKYLLRTLADLIGQSPKARKLVRQRFNRLSYIKVSLNDEIEANSPELIPYRTVINLNETIRTLTPQKTLLIKRGIGEGLIEATIDINQSGEEATAELRGRLNRMFIRSTMSNEISKFISDAVEIAYETYLKPAIGSEILEATILKAEESAVEIMAENLSELLLSCPQRPLRRVLGVYPEEGDIIHVACLEPMGNFAEATVMTVATLRPLTDPYGTSEHLSFLLDRNQIEHVAIADLPGAKTFENMVRNLGLPRPVLVNYLDPRLCELVADADLEKDPALSASADAIFSRPIATGRIFMDPLTQYVKVRPELLVDPALHPEEIDQKMLSERLEEVVCSAVCKVGPDPNTATGEMLRFVPGLGQKLADNIIAYRNSNGRFKSRAELMNVARIGAKAYLLSSGFLRIAGADNPLDQTFVHPDRYEKIEEIAKDLGGETERLCHNSQLRATLLQLIPTYANRNLNAATLKSIVEALKTGIEDTRIIEITPASNKTSLKNQENQRTGTVSQGHPMQQMSVDPTFIATLHIGQILEGRVSHMAHYGAFVNIGHNTSGLLHVSQMSENFVSRPDEVVSTGQTLKVKILDIDPRQLRIALTLKGIEQV